MCVSDGAVVEHVANVRADALGHDEGTGSARLGKDKREFFASVAAGDVDFAHARQDDVAAKSEGLVSDEVSVDIVDGLEVIEVQHHDRESETIATSSLELPPQADVEELAIVEARQPVGDGASLGLEIGGHFDELRIAKLWLRGLEIVERGEL